MAGATLRHNRIAGNIFRGAGNRLEGTSCEVFGSDMRVRPVGDRYFYPNVSIVCGPPAFFDRTEDTLLNPIAIVEVLSDSTQDYDRGGKFDQYRRLPTLREYVAAAQNSVLIEHHVWQPDGAWVLRELTALADRLILASVGIELPLAEIYARVEFPPPE